MTIITNIAPSTPFVPTAASEPAIPPAATFTEPTTADDSAPPSAAGDVFSALMPDASRAAAPAANDDGASADQSGSSKRPKTTNPVFEGRAEMGLRRVVSKRLIAAREASGLGQQEAARDIGYGSSAQLSQWEAGRRFPPTSELLKIAKLYNTTVSFLLGEAPEMARDPAEGLRVAMLNGVRSQLSRCAEVVVAEVSRHARMAGIDSGSASQFIAAGTELLNAVRGLERLNPGLIDDMRGGATMVFKAETFELALLDASRRQRAAQALDSDLRERLASLTDGDIAIEEDA